MRRIVVVFVLLIAVVLAYPAGLLWRSTGTQLQLQEPVNVLGAATAVRLVAVNPHGVRRLRASVEQGGKTFPVYEKSQAAHWWSLMRKVENPETFEFAAGTKVAAGVRDGKGVLRIEAVSNDLRGRTDTLLLEVEVNSQPPGLSVDEGQHYITLGGSEVVAFTASGYWTEAGVRVGKYTFRSFPLPGGGSANRRVAFFAYPHDSPAGEVPVVYVRNPAGAEATGQFWNKVTRKKFRTREIILTDGFLRKIFGELDKGGSGDAVMRFTKINKDLRQRNNQALAEFRNQTADTILWKGPFLQLANSSVEAQFCDFRKYFYQGNSVDEQVHLGFDLAVTAHTPVVAANDGKVVHAAHLGIYGNTVVVDHGLGLQSLYAHLSEFGVKAGDVVKKGQAVGKSGATGLAGGDHLHFGMMVDGAPVNPVEWWDGHWIQDRVMSRLK